MVAKNLASAMESDRPTKHYTLSRSISWTFWSSFRSGRQSMPGSKRRRAYPHQSGRTTAIGVMRLPKPAINRVLLPALKNDR